MKPIDATDTTYKGRFAPSPTGPLHAGSLLTALASYLDAKAHGGQWIIRIEDIDSTRCQDQWSQAILHQLDFYGLRSDEEVVYQSKRLPLYQKAFEQLQQLNLIYPCSCSRKQIQLYLENQTQHPQHLAIYLGPCKTQAAKPNHAWAWRLRSDAAVAMWQNKNLQTQANSNLKNSCILWQDRLLGEQSQDLIHEVGDFVIKRSDGLFAYQLAVVVDDLDQGITDIVRGQDLADNTARQLALLSCLSTTAKVLPIWRYFHCPLVLHTDGEKLSKQNGAKPLSTTENPLIALNCAALQLGLPTQALHIPLATALVNWTLNWHQKIAFEKIRPTQ